SSCAVGSDTSPLTGLGGTVIGYHQAWNVYFNGSIADVQVYNSTLSAAQVSQLYREGINSGPIGNAKLVGWWPLDGNANDYSGNGNNGAPANINYGDVAQINARLSSISGIGSGNMPIGVVPDVGTPSPGYGVHTGSNGNATIFITSNALIGRANVTLTGYKYNSNLADNIVGWWPLDEGYGSKVYDASGNGNTGTFVNPSWTHFANKTALQVAQFNGVSSYITTNYVQTAATSYTIVAWIRTTKGSLQTVVQDRGSGAGHSLTLGFNGCGAPSGGIFFADDLNGVIIGVSNATPLDNGAWYMVAGTFNAPSGTSISPSQFTLYINGKPASATGSCAVGSDTSPLTGLGGTVIGYHQAWNVYFNGSIANVQIYNNSLSPAQISQLYHEGISGIPLNNRGLAGWWPLDGNANDYLVYANGGTANSIVFSNAQIAIAATGSMPVANFNGVSSYVDAGNPASLQFSSGTTMVLSAWVKIINCNHAGAIIGHGTSSYILYYYPAAGGTCNINFASSNVANIGTGVPITTGAWHNVVVVNNIGTNVYIYIDGTQYGPYTFTNTYSYTEDLRIGDSQSDSGYFFNGSIADLQIYNTSLTQQQVQQLYAQGLPLYSKVNISLS
ncbi:MAG: LamG domain-containing protein, partial [Candidatus Marsarchaeota archaeon]|nr:LamG domain-containing protein [Candidatus Marsarchaeota archaeon]